jgi:scyllo-inositol 2-dehydrogenase (NADP+)
MGHEGPIRVGVIGYGRAAVQQHARELEALIDKFQIVAVCVRSKERQELARAKYHCAIYGDYRDLLKDTNVELVDITTPSVDHAPMAIAALEADQHVFLEKPISVSYAEAEALLAAAKRSQGKLLVRHNRRFFSDFAQVKEIIDSGLLGEVFLIRVRCLKYDLRDDWQTLKERGGGILLNVGPHFIDHCMELLGWKYESLWADAKLVAARGDAEDHAKIIFRGEGGQVVDLEISGGAALDEVSLAAYGKHGALTCDGKTIRVKYYDPHKVVPRAARPGSPDMNAPFGSGMTIPWIEETIPVRPSQREIWNEVYKAVREGGEFPITVEQAVQVMRVIDEVKGMTGYGSPAS